MTPLKDTLICCCGQNSALREKQKRQALFFFYFSFVSLSSLSFSLPVWTPPASCLGIAWRADKDRRIQRAYQTQCIQYTDMYAENIQYIQVYTDVKTQPLPHPSLSLSHTHTCTQRNKQKQRTPSLTHACSDYIRTLLGNLSWQLGLGSLHKIMLLCSGCWLWAVVYKRVPPLLFCLNSWHVIQ